jgi:cation transport ATPase
MKTTFAVKHLDCASCAMVMEGICEDAPGVTKAEVQIGKKQLVVEHDESLNVGELQKALSTEGYPVEPNN